MYWDIYWQRFIYRFSLVAFQSIIHRAKTPLKGKNNNIITCNVSIIIVISFSISIIVIIDSISIIFNIGIISNNGLICSTFVNILAAVAAAVQLVCCLFIFL